MQIGTEIYYTGDMANPSGWFRVTGVEQPGHGLFLEELPGGFDRDMHINASNVGTVYKGHCNPRFVTRAAYTAYRQSKYGTPPSDTLTESCAI